MPGKSNIHNKHEHFITHTTHICHSKPYTERDATRTYTSHHTSQPEHTYNPNMTHTKRNKYILNTTGYNKPEHYKQKHTNKHTTIKQQTNKTQHILYTHNNTVETTKHKHTTQHTYTHQPNINTNKTNMTNYTQQNKQCIMAL